MDVVSAGERDDAIDDGVEAGWGGCTGAGGYGE